MRVLVVLSALVAFVAAAALTPAELQMLDTFDYDELFANDEQRNIFFDCMLEKGECGAYKQIAEISFKVVASQCADCSPALKTDYERILKQLHEYEPFYTELMKKIAAKKE